MQTLSHRCRASILVILPAVLLCGLAGMGTACRTMDAPTQSSGRTSLAGQWRFELDRDDAGIDQRWFSRDLADRIQLPGALQHQGYGDRIDVNTPWVAKLIDVRWYQKAKYGKYTQPGNVLVPFFLTPRRHYVGAAWYQRDIEIPAAWQGRRVVLTLERPHWETRVWVDDTAVGNNRSLATPHVYDLGTALAPGRHRLTIRRAGGPRRVSRGETKCSQTIDGSLRNRCLCNRAIKRVPDRHGTISPWCFWGKGRRTRRTMETFALRTFREL